MDAIRLTLAGLDNTWLQPPALGPVQQKHLKAVHKAADLLLRDGNFPAGDYRSGAERT